MDSQIRKVLSFAREKIESANKHKELEDLYLNLFGKDGKLTQLTKGIANLPQSEKPRFGKKINEVKAQIEKLLDTKRISLKKGKPQKQIDITEPGQKNPIGHLHL